MMLKNKKTGLLILIITCSGIIHASSFFLAQTTTSALPASSIEMTTRHFLVHDPIAREKRQASLILPKESTSYAPKIAEIKPTPQDPSKMQSSEKPPLTNRIDSLVASKKQDSDAIFW